MNSHKENKILPLLAMLITWPIFGAWITLFRRQWIIMPLGVLLGAVINPAFYRTKRFFIALLYFAIICFYGLFGVDYFQGWPQIFVDGCMLIFTGALATSIVSEGNDRTYKFITGFSVVMLFVTAIASVYFNNQHPEIIRMIGHATPEVEALQLQCQRYGMAGYDLPHAIPIIIPAFVIWFKNTKVLGQRILALGCVVLTVMLTLASGATTPILLSILIVFLSFITKTGTVRQNLVRIVLVALILLVVMNENVQLMLFSFLDSIVGGSDSIHARIIELQESIVYGKMGGDLEGRVNLYTESITTFFSHPIFGSMDKSQIGGHAVLLDRLGIYGIVGFWPYVAFLIMQFRHNLQFITKGYESYYIVSLVACLIIMATKNFDGWYQWCLLMVLAPAMINEFSGCNNRIDYNEEVNESRN